MPGLCAGLYLKDQEILYMSQVYLRFRRETAYDPVDTAADLQDEVTAYVMNEKYMPKKWRYLIGKGIIDKCDELLDNVIAANETWAKGKRNMELRKELWEEAYKNCKQLDRKLTRAMKVVPTVTAKSLNNIADLLYKEEGFLIQKKNHDKEMG